jgi:ribosomal protein L11 methyltransferase
VPVVLVFEVDVVHAEALSERLLEMGAASVELTDAAAGTAEERALFDEPGAERSAWARWQLRVMAEDRRAGADLLEAACEATGVPVPTAIATEVLEDQDWVRATQAQFGPIRVSERLWIAPSWSRAPDPKAVVVMLDPGRAFGTGSHVTTLLCLQWLEREVRGGETVLDYGCGSGILAIAARKLGAAHAVGVDVDADAVLTARENAARNGVSCEFLDANERLDVLADIVVANILAGPLILLAPALAAHTRAGGRLALAGLLAHQFHEVAEAYAPWFDVEPAVEDQGWSRLAATRNTRLG